MPSLVQILRHHVALWLVCSVSLWSAACGSTNPSEMRKSDSDNTDKKVDIEDEPDDGKAGKDGNDGDGKDLDAPQTKFLAPLTANDPTVDGAYEIKVAFAEQPEGTTWSLYYSRNKLDTAAGTIVLADQSLQTVSYTWSMGGLEEGEYFFFLTLNFDNGGTSVVSAKGSVDYREAGATSNVSPQITALDPEFAAGTRLVSTTETVNISYSVFDADGDDIKVKIELSDDGGVTYTTLLTENGPQDGYSWNVSDSGVEEGLYHLRITASDGVSVPDEQTSSAPFAVSGNTTYTYENDIRPILAANCTQCHDEGGDGFTQFQWASYGAGPGGAPDKFAGYMSERITTLAVDFETMPKDGPPLDAVDRTKIKIWFLQGAEP